MLKQRVVYGIDPTDTIQENAEVIIPARVADLLVWEKFITNPANVPELHQMRIAAKRLRYTMELFAPFYGQSFKDAIEKVKNVQEAVGDIHDADVLAPEMQRHLRSSLRISQKDILRKGVYAGDYDAAMGLLILCRKKRDERKSKYRQFLAYWKSLRVEGFFESIRDIMKEQKAEEGKGVKHNERNRASRSSGAGDSVGRGGFTGEDSQSRSDKAANA